MQTTQHDWQSPATQIAARATLAKHGVRLVSEKDNPTRAELLADRNECRRVINDVRDQAMAAAKKGDTKASETLLDEMHALSAFTARVQSGLDMDELAREVGGASKGSQWGTNAKAVPVLAKGESFGAGLSDGRSAGYGFGDYVAAMVRGTENHDIRAALSEGTDSAGGYTVPTRLMTQLIDAMRAKTSVIQAGAQTVRLDTQKTNIARLASDPSAAWRLEAGTVAESDPTFEQVQFNARSLAVLVKVSREVLDDTVNLNEALMNAFAKSMAVETDRVCLFGTGTAPEPRGVVNTTNVGSVSMGTNGAALADWSKVLDTILELKQDNANDPTAMILAPRTWRTIEGFVDSQGQPLRAPQSIERIPRLVSTTVPVNQTQGTANNASTIVLGDFMQMMLGVRSELRIEVLREKYADTLQYGFIAHLRFDVQLAHPQSFAKLIGITP